VRLEGLGQLKISNDFIGNQTRDLQACSIVLQPNTVPHDPAVRRRGNRNLKYGSNVSMETGYPETLHGFPHIL
jgi:hypothetical protein